MSDGEKLKEENSKLQRQLENAREWMRREILESQKSVLWKKEIEEKLMHFLPTGSLNYLPENAFENVTSSEVLFRYLEQDSSIDGVTIVMGYQKVLDDMLEIYVISPFRSYIKKSTKNPVFSSQHTHIEKSLKNIIERKYSLSLGRLYEILSLLSKDIELKQDSYTSSFCEYLKSSTTLSNTLLQEKFLLQLGSLIDMKVMGEKRHAGFLDKQTTQQARDICIGQLEDSECLIHMLAQIQSLDV